MESRLPMQLPRGLRNNNAGNIRKSSTRYLGEVRPSSDKAFKQFETRGWGYRAIFVLLESYSKRGFKTLRQMINRYAPPIENNTNRYINRLCSLALIEPHSRVNTADHDKMVAIVAAISTIENGVKADMAAVERGWQLFKKDYISLNANKA